jgi:hypothetical protein
VQKEALIAESVLLIGLMGLVLWQRRKRELKRWWQAWRAKPKRPWTLRQRTPEDCMDCRLAPAEHGPSRTQGPRPWSEVKSKRGRPKTHDSSGQAWMGNATPVKPPTNGNAVPAAVNIPPGWTHRCTGSKQLVMR